MTSLLRRGLTWRPCPADRVAEVRRRLAAWPCSVGGAVRHMFALSTLDGRGHAPIRLAEDDERWAAAVVFPGRLVVPCGDAAAIAEAGQPTRRWRLLVGDARACDALLDHVSPDPGLRVHHQRFMTVEAGRVPGTGELPDPGLRRAVQADLDGLADLAVQLHVDDRFGPDPGRSGRRGYRRRLQGTVDRGVVYCVGPVGAPVAKLERSVSSPRWGVQLAGIVVRPDERHRGLGRALVAAAVRQALREEPERPVSLHVRADNHRAIRAYEAAGFRDREKWRLAVRG